MNEFLNDPEIMGEFINESREHLESLEPKLLQLEKEPHNLDLLNDIFRSFHTLKGSSSFLGLTQIIELSHKSESILDKLRREELKVTPEIIDFIFKTADILKSLIEDVASGKEDKIKGVTANLSKDISEIINKIEETIEKPPSKEKELKIEAKKIDNEEKEVFLNATQQYLSTIVECINKLKKGTYEQEVINALFRTFHSLKSSADYMKFSEIKDIAEEKEDLLQKIREKKISISKETVDELNSSYNILVKLIKNIEKSGEELLQPEFISSKEEKTEKKISPEKPLPQKKIRLEKTIRVSENKLDLLMNLAGELIINRGGLFSIAQKLEAGEKISETCKQLRETIEVMNRITRDLQTVVMDIHMLPIKNLFNKFPRMIRDLCRKKNKKIELKISGEETHLDKMMIEKLGDPLIHLIRNSVDHGIETPEERRAKGKPEKGTIKLSAFQEGESVTIKIEDDGKGINPELICQTAIKKGIINEEKIKSLNKKERLNLIFLPGFSTAKKVTDISGRGVGMDVVMTAVKDLRGEIDVDTHIDRGTVFTITLPLTLAILKVFLIEVNKQTFALPLSSVKETLQINSNQIKGILNKESIVVRNRVVGIARLSDLLNLTHNGNKNRHISIVIIEGGGKELGIAVDALQREEEIVIKPLEGCLADTKGLAGATILGDGRVVLILDPRELIQLAINGR
ncbi:chemotaxis protein CheA [Candidatus Aerophobetes bacterium]|nr:chemotaxis protein CheA [Candidatus Aerophobetes bacterium]